MSRSYSGFAMSVRLRRVTRRALAAVSAVAVTVIALLVGATPAQAYGSACRPDWADTCIDVTATGQVTGWVRVDPRYVAGDGYFQSANVYVMQCRGDLTACSKNFAATSGSGTNIVSTRRKQGAYGHAYRACASYTIYTNVGGGAYFHEVNVCSPWKTYP